MLEGADDPRSPAWWFKVLASDLQDRRHGRRDGKRWNRQAGKPSRIPPGLDLLDDHLRGDPPLLGCAEGWRDGFREVVRLGRLNVAALVVGAKVNRMQLRDFRTAAAEDELGDERAREIMREANLAVKARHVHRYMLGLRDGYAMVTPAGENEIPFVTAEDPRECITAEDPLTGRTIAALKMYRDEWDAADVGHLFIREDDGRVSHRIARKRGRTALTSTAFTLSKAWTWEKVNADGDLVDYVPQNRMPIVRFPNRDGVGEFELHLDTLDRINDQILNKLVIGKLQAFRQRAVKGLPRSEKKIVDGKLVDVEIDYTDAFLAGPGELWTLPPDAEFWESEPTDFRPLLESIKDDLEHLAAVTSTPLHILTPDAASGSAEGAGLMREENVYAVEACRANADRSWAEVMATCFAFMGDTTRAKQSAIEPIWGPAERYTLAEKADAAAKGKDSLPTEAIQRDIWQYPPAEIPNLRMMRGRDFLTAPGATTQDTLFPAPTGAPTPTPTPADGADAAAAS